MPAGSQIAAHTLTAPNAVRSLRSDARRGLTAAQAAERLARDGPNQLAEAPPTPAWRRFLDQFRELVVWILVVAAAIAGGTGDWTDTLAILAIVLMNAVLGFLQEARAERALAALRQLSAPQAKVVREGTPQWVAARELVCGDLIELEAGDHVPADARLLEAIGLRAQEAALSGESVPVDKDVGVGLDARTALSERRNMVHMGTVIATGKGRAVVAATGMATELGRIAGMLQHSERKPTPLQRRLTELGKVLVFVCLAIVAVIFTIELLRGRPFVEVLLLSVSLAVAAVPEGLAAVVTVALARGLQRMARRNALVRHLPSVETLGSVTVICSDKTGTLTRNEMTVREVLVGAAHYRVSGVGYAPRGHFWRRVPGGSTGVVVAASGSDERVDPHTDGDLLLALEIGARCNNARLSPSGDDDWQVIGDPTEGALLVAALKANLDISPPAHGLLYELPFDSERRAMSVVLRRPDGVAVMYTKGAPEVILARCVAERRGGMVEPLTETRRQAFLAANAAMAAGALRVLAFAYREWPDSGGVPQAEVDLTFVGLVGMIDPPRDAAKAAVATCRAAGIRPVMITGDHVATALAIARELGIATDRLRAVTGAELDGLSDDALAAQVDDIAVYARVAAEHKLRIVRAWKARGEIVAMTGDGVNDAPAVRAADIGIAMGRGTDVTKEASDMVLTDENFASIVSAVEEGRSIFDNIRKFVHYLLSCNAGEILVMFVAALLGWPAPLLPIQILWINLVTDGLPALALGVEPAEPDIMRRPPRPPHEPVITGPHGLRMLAHGVLIAAVTLGGFALALGSEGGTLAQARTVAFCVVAYAQLLYAFACRGERYTALEMGLFSNPYLCGAIAISGLLQLSVVALPFAQPVFRVPVTPSWEWGAVALLALLPLTIVEVAKLLRRGLRRRRS